MTDDPRGRTYSSWWFLGAFTVLAGVGLVALLTVGMPGGPTEIVPTAQTLPDGQPARPVADGPTTTTPTTTTPTTDPPTTSEPADAPPPPPDGDAPVFADGSPAPDEVSEVLVDGDTTVLAFRLPPGTDPSAYDARIAPVSAAIRDAGSVLGVRVGCTASTDELVAQLAVVESADDVTLTAVTLVPPGGPPCEPGSASAVVDVPLRSPIDGRPVRITPPGDPSVG